MTTVFPYTVHAFNHNPRMASSAGACGGQGCRGPLRDVNCGPCLERVLPRIRPAEDMPDGYYDAYCAAARMRQSTRAAAQIWYALGVAAEVAGAWGRLGYNPQQGWYWMNRDVTPERAAQLDQEAKR